MTGANAQYAIPEPKNTLQNPLSDQTRTTADHIAALKDEKERVISYEKERLKIEIERLDALVSKDSLTAGKAQEMKEAAARIAALNIDNKTAIIENQMALLERGERFSSSPYTGSVIELGLGNAYDENGSALFGIHYRAGAGKPVKYDRRTFSDVVIAGGLSNVRLSGESGSPYKTWGSVYWELGYTWRTRLDKDDNYFRLAYGLSFQMTVLQPSENRVFVDDFQGHTTLEPFDHKLKWNKMYFTNLVFPVFLEFGPSKKVVHPDRVRYYINDKFKMGIGAFAGFNIRTAQWLKWKEDGNRRQQKIIEDYNTNNLVYGLATYVGYGPMSLYLKYDLNPLFKNAERREHLFSIALRADL